MADSNITASIVVQFGDATGVNTHLSIEIDSRSVADGGLNEGKTSFSAGDTVYLLAYYSSDVTLLSHTSSAGVLTKLPASILAPNTVPEYISFSDSDTASATKPISANFTYQWVGNNHNLGSLVATTGTPSLRATAKTTEEVGVASIVYNSIASVYKLETPAEINSSTDFQILCVVFAEVT